MVGPVTREERTSFVRKLRIIVVFLVGASTGLVAVAVDATPPQAVGSLVAGLAVGALVAWYAVPSASMPSDRRARSRRSRVADGSGDRPVTDDPRERDEDSPGDRPE
jgi:uncharacterized protein (DUF2062 family)